MLEYRILGPLEVADSDRPLHLGAPKQRATLAILLLHANRVVSVDRLADELYAGAPPVTAVTQIQRQISELRKALGSASAIETRSSGYALRASREQLDLIRFESLAAEGGEALERGDAFRAAEALRDALALWRGPPLADFTYEPFAQAPIGRLDELRLAALEQRLDADLALGRHSELVAELEALAAEDPLREAFQRQLMLALYRSGRQAEALEVYRRGRELLRDEYGLEPTPTLQRLEREILTHDPSLERSARVHAAGAEPLRALLVVAEEDTRVDELLAVAAPLATLPARELLVVRLVRHEDEVEHAAELLRGRRDALHGNVRLAALTPEERAEDVLRLAGAYDVELVLMDAAAGLAETVPDGLRAVLERSAADVAVLAGSPATANGEGISVPFGGAEHDWAALELAAQLASATRSPLRLVGTKAAGTNARDASRLLADASIAVQRVVGLDATPQLAEPTSDGLARAVEPARLVVFGISPRWRREGIGASRAALIGREHPPVVLVHSGPRPGGLAPRRARTRFTWSLAPAVA